MKLIAAVIAVLVATQARSFNNPPAEEVINCSIMKTQYGRANCEDVKNKYRDCVAYNARLDNNFDCSKQINQADAELNDRIGIKLEQQARPAPKIGMSAKEVRTKTFWADPDHINRTTTRNAIDEQWVYRSHGYLYFRNGKVIAIQD